MHRHGVRCLEFSGVKAPLLRQYSVAAGATRSAAATATRKFRRRPVEVQAGIEDLSVFTTELVKNTVRGDRPGWKRTLVDGGEQRRLEALVSTPTDRRTPSAEQKIFSASAAEFVGDDSIAMSAQSLPVGTFVEIRRNFITTHGVIFHQAGGTRRPVILSMTSTGELWEHAAGDVMFAVPDFVDANIIARCGINIDAITENQANARITVLKRIKDLEKTVEVEYHAVSSALSHALSRAQLELREPDIWKSITTTEAARMITTKRTIPLVTLLCVHKCLMEHPKMFVADIRGFLRSQEFLIRPLAEMEDLEAALSRIGRNDKSVEAFVEKARNLITAYRNRPPPGEGEPSVVPRTDCVFTEEDQLYIRFLMQTLRSTRTTQKDVAAVATAILMKRIGMYPGVRISSTEVHGMLIEMGVLAPWDEPNARDPLSKGLAEPVHAKVTPGVPQSPTPHLSPDEFYPHDIVESIRYDFGDMPVYVIDDVGANELDDGISVESISTEPDNYWVHVHIADPTALLHPDHKLTRQARKALSALYFPQGNDPLFPPEIVHNGMSLGSQEGPSKVLTFSFKVDGYGHIADYSVRAGLVRNVHVLRYDDVNAALGMTQVKAVYPFGRDTPPPPPAYSESQQTDLRTLVGIADKLAFVRQSGGAFLFSLPESSVKILSPPPRDLSSMTLPSLFTGFPKMEYAIQPCNYPDYGSRRLVSESMKCACRVASLFLRDHRVPALRRAAEPIFTKTEEDMMDLLSMRDEFGFVDFFEVMKREVIVPGAIYTRETKGHWQLGVPEGEGYVRVTSPLRRYLDLVAHWQIKQVLLSRITGASPRLFTEQWLDDLAADCARQEVDSRVIERRSNKFWTIKFIERKLNEPVKADIFEQLVAYPMFTSLLNTQSREAQTQVHIPALGTIAAMSSPKATLEDIAVGQPYRVELEGMRLGLSPELLVKMV